jgi:hypothetical protein
MRGMRGLYVDWELDAEDHRYRLGCFGDDIPEGVLYRRCRKPLVQEIDSLRRIGKSERIDYYILDSVGYGTAGDPAAADAALDFCRAFGQLGKGGLALAHITKNGDNNDQMPYGSMFWHASARATFFLKLAAEDGDTRFVGVFTRKRNLGRLQPPVGLRVTFAEDRVEFDHTDITDVPDLAESLPLWRRIQAVVKAGPQTLATIARELNHDNVESIDRTVRKHKQVFTRLSGSDGITRIALVERRAA